MTSNQRPGIPAFVGVYDRLRELIRRDDLGPGEALPSDSELSGELSVSRELIREALLLLVEDGHVTRQKDRRWHVAEPEAATSYADPFPTLLSAVVTPVRRLHGAVEGGSSWSRELLRSDGPFLVWETVFARDGVLLVSTLEVMLASAVPTEVMDSDLTSVEPWPTLLDALDPERRAAMSLEGWRLTSLSRNTERLSWMELPMHGIPAALTVVLGEAGTPTYLAKNVFDLGTFGLAVHG